MSLIGQINEQHKARLDRMNARAVPDVPMDLKKDRGIAAPKETCEEEKAEADRILIADLQAQVVFLRAALAHPIKAFPQSEIAAERFECVLEEGPGRVTVAGIKQLICREYNVSAANLESHCREAPFNFPRQIAMHLVRQHTSNSLPAIGRQFGGRDHTTVLHADQKLVALRKTDLRLDAEIAGYERQLLAGL